MRSTTATAGRSSTPASTPPPCREAWERLLAGPLAGRPVARVILTHHHPDHVGLAGWFQARGAELWATRTAWLMARMLTLDVQDRPTPETLAFWRGAGMPPEMLAERAATRPFNFADLVAPMPLGYRRIVEGEEIARRRAALAGRDRPRARAGAGDALGHRPRPRPRRRPDAPRHHPEPRGPRQRARRRPGRRLARLLPPASPGWPTSATWRSPATAGRSAACPPASPSTRRTAPPASIGCAASSPSRAGRRECFGVLYGRSIGASEYGLALAEAVGHLNHLRRAGEADRRLGPDGAWLWQSRDFVPDSDAASR